VKVGIACDHAGYELKEQLKSFLVSMGLETVDLGAFREDSVDYPDYGSLLAEKVSKKDLERGILICGTGIGMSIVANKFAGVRAALVHDTYSAQCSREHNDANVLVMGGRVIGREVAKEIVKIWLNTPFAGGRHQERLKKIEALEKEKFR
jgi:ribose 5-phosphate isomerase B